MLPSHRAFRPADRRRNRTTDALRALTRLLEAARRRSGLEALAIAEGGGFLVAGSGPARLCDELAAWAPLASSAPANDAIPSRIDLVERHAILQRLSIDGIQIIVCGSGSGDGEKARRELGAVAEGCKRILEAAPPHTAS